MKFLRKTAHKANPPAEKTVDGLVCAYLLTGDGKAREAGWKEIRAWTPESGILWVHLNRAEAAAQSWLRKQAGLDPVMADALIASETRPRSLITEQGMLVSLRGINFNPGAEPEDMIAMRMFVEPRRIITTRTRKLMAVDDLRTLFDAGAGPKTASDCFLALAQSLIGRVSSVLDDLDDTADDLEEQLLEPGGVDRALRDRLTILRRRAIAIRRYMAPQREALAKIADSTARQNPMDGNDVAILRELADQNTRAVEDLDAIRERAAVIQDELVNRLSDRLNRNSYILTVGAALFLPLTVVTSLLGVNVGGMDTGNVGPGFWLLCTVLGGFILVELILFKILKWI